MFSEYSCRLAFEMLKNNVTEVKGNIGIWKDYFNLENNLTVLKLSGCPILTTYGNRYSFINKSFLEYFAARYIATAIDKAEVFNTIELDDITRN